MQTITKEKLDLRSGRTVWLVTQSWPHTAKSVSLDFDSEAQADLYIMQVRELERAILDQYRETGEL